MQHGSQDDTPGSIPKLGDRAASGVAIRIAGFLVASAAFIYFAAARAKWFIDDTFIYQRIVRNAVNGHGLSYAAAEPVEAFSSPLWTLLLTLIGELGVRGFVPARLLGVACGLATLALAGFAMRPRGPREAWSHVGIVLVLALQPSLAWWAVSGMETPLCVVLVMALVVAVRRSDRLVACAVAGLLAVTRPEGILFAASTAIWTLATLAPERRTPLAILRAAALPLSLVAAPWLAWEAYRIVHFGRFVANSADAKLAVDAILTTPTPRLRSLSYPLSSLRAFPGEWLLFVTAVAVTVVEAKRERRDFFLFASLSTMAILAFTVVVRGDWMPECRFVLPLIPVLVTASAERFDELRGTARKAMTLSLVLAFSLGVLRHHFEVHPKGSPFIAPAAPVLPTASLSPLWEPVTADAWSHDYARFALRYTQPGESVLHLDVGQSGYLLEDLSVLDQFGLVSTFECDVVRNRRTAEAMLEQFRRLRPSIAFVLVEQGTKVPATKVAMPLRDELDAQYVEVWRHAWWGPHDMRIMVHRDALSRRVDSRRVDALVEGSRGLAWMRERLMVE